MRVKYTKGGIGKGRTVPFDLTNGSAKHCWPESHDSISHIPVVVVVLVASVDVVVVFEEVLNVHVANSPLMQAVSPTGRSSCRYAYRTTV